MVALMLTSILVSFNPWIASLKAGLVVELVQRQRVKANFKCIFSCSVMTPPSVKISPSTIKASGFLSHNFSEKLASHFRESKTPNLTILSHNSEVFFKGKKASGTSSAMTNKVRVDIARHGRRGKRQRYGLC